MAEEVINTPAPQRLTEPCNLIEKEIFKRKEINASFTPLGEKNKIIMLKITLLKVKQIKFIHLSDIMWDNVT